MITYKDLIETVIKREMAIVGQSGVLEITKSLGLNVNEEGSLANGNINDEKKILEDMMQKFLDRYGIISIIGCRIEVRKIARRNNLELPPIFY